MHREKKDGREKEVTKRIFKKVKVMDGMFYN